MPIPDTQLRASLKAAGDFLNRRRPAPEIRDQVDFEVDIKGSDVVILEVRPRYNDKTKIIKRGFAKMKWVGTRKVWRLYWMRADMKWHSYIPKPQAREIEALFEEVGKDPHGCFFG